MVIKVIIESLVATELTERSMGNMLYFECETLRAQSLHTIILNHSLNTRGQLNIYHTRHIHIQIHTSTYSHISLIHAGTWTGIGNDVTHSSAPVQGHIADSLDLLGRQTTFPFQEGESTPTFIL